MISRYPGRRALRLALIGSAAPIGIALAAPALAQSALPTPPTSYAIDVNGVDLPSGTFYVQTTPLAIGSGDAGLSYRISQGSASFESYSTQLVGDTSGITVDLGTISDFFSTSGGISKNGTGAKLSAVGSPGSYDYTTRGGTVYHFDSAYREQVHIVESKLGTITYPDGRIETLHYQIVPYEFCTTTRCTGIMWQATRLTSVTTNDGYEFDFSYASNNTSCDFNDVATCLTPWMTETGVSAKNNAGTAPAGGWPAISFGSTSSAQTITDPMGRVLSITYAAGKIVGVRPPGSASDTITLAYDSNGRVHTVTRGGHTWTYGYVDTSTTRTTTVTDPLSHTHVVESDLATGRVTKNTDELHNETSYLYNSLGDVIRVTYPENNYTVYGYDSRSNLMIVTVHPKSGTGTIVTHAAYDSTCANIKTCNKPNTTTDAEGNITNYTYSPSTGQITKITHPAPSTGAAQPEERYGYTLVHAWYKNAVGTLVEDPTAISKLTSISACASGASCAGTASETKTTIGYGVGGVANNRLPTAVTKAAGDGSVSSRNGLSFDALGNLIAVDGPQSGTADTTFYRYDLDRERLGMILPDPDGAGSLEHRATRITYNDDGQVGEVEQGTVTGTDDPAWAAFASKQQVTTSYDVYGRKTRTAVTAGGTIYGETQYSYDALSRPDCTAVRMNSATWNAQPDVCLPQTSGSAGPDRITRTSYDAASQVTKTTSAYGVTGTQADDATATWSDNGKLATLTDAEGNKTTYIYDTFDRLSKTEYPDMLKGSGVSSTTDYEQLTYDGGALGNGNVTSRRLRDGSSIGYAYDHLDRLTAKNLPGSEPDVTYAYDNFGRPTSISQTGNALSFGYDALSRLKTETGPQGTLTSTWDAAGRRTRLQWPDGFYVNYDHDVLGEMTKVRENGATSGVGVLASYTYDDLGNRTGATFGNGTSASWTPDPLSRLASLVHNLGGTSDDLTRTFAYNPASQIASLTSSNDAYAWNGAANVNRSYTTNGLNQYTLSGGTALGYDTRGNLTTSGTDSYTYSSENLLKTGPGSTSLSYDPLLRLYQVTQGSSTTRFAYDGLAMAAEYNSSNSLQKRYVYGPGADEPIVQYTGTGTTNRAWLAADERGSVIALTDSSGTPTAIDSYDEYGIPGTANSGRFQYTGQAWLPELGLYYYKARFYSPSLGRFLQTDPIGYGDGLNWYNYTGSDPVNFIDPTGMLHQECTYDVTATISWTDGVGYVETDSVTPHCSEIMDWYDWLPTPSLGGAELGGLPGRGGNVTAPKQTSPQRIADYFGPTYCGAPTVGALNDYNPFGRVNSGKTGGVNTALKDVNYLATLNGIQPLNLTLTSSDIFQRAISSPIPSPIGGGWYGSKNLLTGYWSLSNRGLSFRVQPEDMNIRIDIPAGFLIDSAGTRLSEKETCHYNR